MTELPDAFAPGAHALPDFDVQLTAPDLSPWLAGNIGMPGFSSFASGQPGPHLVLVGLTHGNEIAGAIVLDRLLREGVRPRRGTLTIGFVNLAAYARFDPAQPTASRYVEEDFNRLWHEDVLCGPRRSLELLRAREIRPMIDRADILLDLHSMLWPSDPLALCGMTAKGRALARSLAAPDLIVADDGHASGRRMMDYTRFTDPASSATAVLVEAGQHWEHATVSLMQRSIASVLPHVGIGTHPPTPTHRVAEVTDIVTAATAQFGFMQAYRGGEVITRRNTLIAMDGVNEIRTPYDNCLLIMPSLRPTRGHTAVRMARLVAD